MTPLLPAFATLFSALASDACVFQRSKCSFKIGNLKFGRLFPPWLEAKTTPFEKKAIQECVAPYQTSASRLTCLFFLSFSLSFSLWLHSYLYHKRIGSVRRSVLSVMHDSLSFPSCMRFTHISSCLPAHGATPSFLPSLSPSIVFCFFSPFLPP